MRLRLTVTVALLFVTPAVADPLDYDRVVAFGDSLSDNGNYANNVPPNGLPPFAPGYFNGRFSNGPTWIEVLSDPALSTNPDSTMNRFWSGFLFLGPYDVGGNVNNVNAAIGFAETVGAGPPPSIQTQIGAFLAAGGVFGPNDLVSVQGGANDFLRFMTLNPGATPDDLANFASFTALNQAGNVQLALTGGAQTILVSNLPNIGATPFLSGNPATAQGGLLATTVFNATLDGAVEQLAAANPAANLIQMDWQAAVDVAAANPAAFGFTNVTEPCFNGITICATPDTYLFWDPAHPSAAAHAYLAQYAGLLLSTEQTGLVVGQLGQLAFASRLTSSDMIFRRGVAPFGDQPRGMYLEGFGEVGSFEGTDTGLLGDTGIDYRTGGGRVGFDANQGMFRYGSSLAFEMGGVSGNLLTADVEGGHIDGYVLASVGPLFGGLEGGVSFDRFGNISRETGFPTVAATGTTSSTGYSIAATLGGQYQVAAVTLTPAVRVGYIGSTVDGFSETAPLLALQYGDHQINSGFWTARVRASIPVVTTVSIYGEVGYEGLIGATSTYTAKLTNNTAQGVTITGDLDLGGFYGKAGLEGTVGPSLKLSGEYGLAVRNGNHLAHTGRARLAFAF